MPELEDFGATYSPKAAWNNGTLVGARPPLQPKHVWAIRTRIRQLGPMLDYVSR